MIMLARVSIQIAMPKRDGGKRSRGIKTIGEGYEDGMGKWKMYNTTAAYLVN
jgi:hypothetical protein